MRILHLIDEPYDSGIVSYALNAAAGLARRGVESSLWAPEDAFPLKEARRLGLPVRGWSHPWLDLAELRRALRAAAPDGVVAHTGSSHTLAVALAGWHGALSIPVIRTRADARALKRRPGRRLLWRRTAGFIAANKSLLAEAARLYPEAVRTSAAIYEGTEDPGKPRPQAAGAPTIGIVARLDPVKGHSVLLDAAAAVLRRYPDVRFLIAGRQENVRAEDLSRRARALGIADRVELAGHVPDAPGLMARCHAGVIASIGSEAVSRAAVEWMAAGRPLVATAVGCLPEYVLDGESGFLVPPSDPAALAEAISRLVADSFLRERMGVAARDRYERLFTLDHFLDETRAFYEKTLNAVPS